MTNKDLKRMIDLMGIRKPINEQTSNSAVELQKKSPNGKVYGIVRENRKYFIKESTDGVNYEYIGGLGNKTKNQYQSYEEAVKRLNIMFEDFNRTYGVQENNDILSSDIITEKKFVLKSKKKKSTPAPAEKESFGETEETETEEGGEDFDFGGGEETDTEEGGEDFDFGTEEEKIQKKILRKQKKVVMKVLILVVMRKVLKIRMKLKPKKVEMKSLMRKMKIMI